MTPSKYQSRIYDFVEKENGSAVVIAVAGSGKTTTIVECAKRIPESNRVAFVAFNKSIADELKQKVPPHVNAMTLNGMGYSALQRHLDTRRFTLDTRKTSVIMDENLTHESLALYGGGLRKLVAIAKAHGIVPRESEGVGLTMDTEQNWADLIEKYDVEFEKDAKPEKAIEIARKVLAKSIELAEDESYIDFDDQLYLPVIWQAKFQQYDLIFVDEAQDVNLVQRAMLKMAVKVGGRLIAVGDPRQAIYGFRGSDVESIANIKREFDAVELPLSVSYRCPKNIVAEAHRFVQHIEPSETAIDGKVERLPNCHPELFDSKDAILCRMTAPVVAFAYKLLRRGKACRVLGRAIGEGLISLIKKMDAKSLDELDRKLDSYREREVQRLMAKGKEEQAEAVHDKVDTVKIFIDQVPETDRTINRLVSMITGLFSDDKRNILTLATIHKSKGLEWPRVFILDAFLMPSRWARQEWQKAQEVNCQYVAVTRAKSELYYIESDTWRDYEVPPSASQAS